MREIVPVDLNLVNSLSASSQVLKSVVETVLRVSVLELIAVNSVNNTVRTSVEVSRGESAVLKSLKLGYMPQVVGFTLHASCNLCH